MNEFKMTLEPKRFDTARKSGLLELIGKTEAFIFHLAEQRGTIERVIFYAKDREPFSAAFDSVTETEKKIVLRFSE